MTATLPTTTAFAVVAETIRARRSCRRYGPEPLDPAVVEALCELARWAPSPSNRQPWKFVVTTDRDRLAAMAADVEVACAGLLARQKGEDPRAVAEYLRNFVHFAEAPAVIALLVRETKNRLVDDLAALEVDSALLAVGAAMQNILLGAEAAGLVACSMSGPLLAKTALEAHLGVEAPWRLVALVSVGHRGEPALPAPERKRLDLVYKHLDHHPKEEA